MLTAKINLTLLKHALLKSTKDPEETLLCIPIKANSLFKSDKGNVYFDIVGFDYQDKTPDKQYPDTHLLKQSFSKDELAKMSEEQKKALPIIGNARVSGSGGGHSEPAPNDAGGGNVADGVDDLPF